MKTHSFLQIPLDGKHWWIYEISIMKTDFGDFSKVNCIGQSDSKHKVADIDVHRHGYSWQHKFYNSMDELLENHFADML